jgi:hypothetical protein
MGPDIRHNFVQYNSEAPRHASRQRFSGTEVIENRSRFGDRLPAVWNVSVTPG